MKYLLIMLPLFLTSCSIYKAATVDTPPDLTTVRRGYPREEIERHLIHSTGVAHYPDGTYAVTYEFMMGTETKMVFGHLMMDFITYGAWELVGTYVENKRGEKFQAVVTYNEDDIVMAISSRPLQDLGPSSN